MKKSLLLLILSSLSLVGCSAERTDNGKSTNVDVDRPPAIPVTGDHTHADLDKDHLCDSCKEKISECIDEDKNNICDICGATLESETNEFTVIIPMCGEAYSSKIPNTQDLTADYAYENFLAYLKSFGEENYINAYSGYCLNSNKHDVDNCQYFTLGTGSGAKFSSGSLTICSSVAITKVEVTAKAYSKYYNSANHPDYGATLVLDGAATELIGAEETSTETISKTVTKDYSTTGGVKQFTIESSVGRVFVEEIKITWKGQNS